MATAMAAGVEFRDAAGTDNEWSRVGPLAAFAVEGVDLASYLVREFDAMAVIAGGSAGRPTPRRSGCGRGNWIKPFNDVFLGREGWFLLRPQ